MSTTEPQQNVSLFTEFVVSGKSEGICVDIEQVTLPQTRELLTSVNSRRDELKRAGVSLTKIGNKKLAEMAKMEQEYEWIFSHTSRKIHAEPFSINSDYEFEQS